MDLANSPQRTHAQQADNTRTRTHSTHTWQALDVIVAHARTNAQDPALVHARFSAPNLILALWRLHMPRPTLRTCVCACFGGSLVYNFKLGLSQPSSDVHTSGSRWRGSWAGCGMTGRGGALRRTRKECARKIRSNVCVTFTAYYSKRRITMRPH